MRRDLTGRAIAVTISNTKTKILLISAYLPPGLDKFGIPQVWSHSDGSQNARSQVEAHAIYEQVTEWITEPYWILGGDLNETRSEALDRKRYNNISSEEKPKFVSRFLELNNAVDVWRTLHQEEWVHLQK